MPTAQLVSARDVLRAIQEVRWLGIDRLFREWERREPDLPAHLLEGISDLHRRVADIAPHPRAEQQLMCRIEMLILVLLTALRRAMLRHWQEAPVPTDEPPSTDGNRANADHRNGGPHMKRKQRRRRAAEAAFKAFHRRIVRLAGYALADDWTARLKRLERVPRLGNVASRITKR